jgi:hypothetical protein
LSERPHHVEVPHGKRPCDGDGFVEHRTGSPCSAVQCPWSLLPLWASRIPAGKPSRQVFSVLHHDHMCLRGSLVASRGLDLCGCTT